MATRRRDTAPRKDKTEASSSHTPNTLHHLKPTPNVISPAQNNGPTAPKKPTPKTPLRPATRSSTGAKKPTPSNTSHSKPTTTTRKTLDKSPLPARVIASPSTRPRDKTPSPAQNARVLTTPSPRPHDKTPPPAHKKHVSTISSLRPRDKTPLPAQTTHVSTPQASSIPKKSTASQKVGSGKNRKPQNKDVGKHSSSSHATPVNATMKTSNICTQELETEKIPTSATKEQTTKSFQETFENTDIYENLPEVDTLLEDQESFTFETVEQIIQVVSDDERDIVAFVPKDQEKPVDIAQTEAKNDHEEEEEETKIVTVEPSPVLEQEAPVDIKTQESEDKPCIEEKLEEVVHEIPSTNNIITSVADELPQEASKEKEVEEVVVVVEKEEEKEKAVDTKDEVAGQSEAIEPVETKVQEVVEKQKQEPEHKAQKQQGWPRVKRDVVSNDTIEETASKLRDQRRNRVRALAGAFESVISSQ